MARQSEFEAAVVRAAEALMMKGWLRREVTEDGRERWVLTEEGKRNIPHDEESTEDWTRRTMGPKD